MRYYRNPRNIAISQGSDDIWTSAPRAIGCVIGRHFFAGNRVHCQRLHTLLDAGFLSRSLYRPRALGLPGWRFPVRTFALFAVGGTGVVRLP